MSEPKKTVVKTFDGECVITERVMKHHKSGKTELYLSFSNGQDVCGFFVGEKTKAEIIKSLTERKGAKGGQRNTNANK